MSRLQIDRDGSPHFGIVSPARDPADISIISHHSR